MSRVSDERVTEILQWYDGGGDPMGLNETEELAIDLRDARARIVELERERDEALRVAGIKREHGAGDWHRAVVVSVLDQFGVPRNVNEFEARLIGALAVQMAHVENNAYTRAAAEIKALREALAVADALRDWWREHGLKLTDYDAARAKVDHDQG